MQWIDEFSGLDGMIAGLMQQWLLTADCSTPWWQRQETLVHPVMTFVLYVYSISLMIQTWPITSVAIHRVYWIVLYSCDFAEDEDFSLLLNALDGKKNLL